MRAGYNYNKMREYSMTVGGLRNVYGGKAEVTLPTGYNMALEDIPSETFSPLALRSVATISQRRPSPTTHLQ